MLKVNPCPNCSTDTIVIIYNAGKGIAWPECQKCEYSGSDKYKNHMTLDAERYIKKGSDGTAEERQALLDYAASLWNEVTSLERLESDPEFAYDNLNSDDTVENEIDLWFDITTEDLVDEDEENSVYKDWFGDKSKDK